MGEALSVEAAEVRGVWCVVLMALVGVAKAIAP